MIVKSSPTPLAMKMKAPSLKFLFSPAHHHGVCRDLDPQAPYWISLGGLTGIALYMLNAPSTAPLHQLLHQRGSIQPISLITGGMVIGFVALKLVLLRREQRLVRTQASQLDLADLNLCTIEAALANADALHGVLGRRWRSLLQLWSATESTSKVTDRLEAETEAFDLAQQNSYALPRILVWAIPVLGFLGTVIGIGSAVGQFDTFLSSADDIDVLRDGLANVTGGLGTAFDTTFLALAISLIVMLPLAAVERIEQRLLTRIDLVLRNALLPVLPDSTSGKGSGVDRLQLEDIVDEAFQRHLPDASALVEPAKIYAENAAQAITVHLEPIKSLAIDSSSAIEAARQCISDQAETVKTSLLEGANRIDASVQSLVPLLEQLNKVQILSSQLDHELKQLESGANLTNSLNELKALLAGVEQTLQAAAKPRQVVLVEQPIVSSVDSNGRSHSLMANGSAANGNGS